MIEAPPRPATRHPAPASAEFDLGGVVGIRLVGATAADVAAIERQLGPIRRPLEREPDLLIRFVPRVAPGRSIRLLGVGDVGYTDDEFLVLRSRHRGGVRVAIPFERLGQPEDGKPPEIVAEHGLPAIPHLVAIVNLLVHARGVAPLHASAFVHRGVGILVTGWAKGGKTEALLAAVANGGSYVADEWAYLRPDGRVFGVPEPIRIWEWQLRQLPGYRDVVSGRDRLRLRGLASAAGMVDRLLGLDPIRRSAPGRVLARTAPVLARQPWVRVPPARLFGEGRIVASTPVERLVLVVSHDRPSYDVIPTTTELVAERMAASVAYEAAELRGAYLAYRFAFPDRRSPLLEADHDGIRDLARASLGDVPAVEVRHPHPFRIEDLFRAVLDATRA